MPRARLVAVCRRDEAAGRRFAGEHGVAWVADPAELADPARVDAVVLVLPPHRHPAAARAALAAGLPVLVEKPLAPDPAGAAELERLVAERGGHLMVAQTLRFDPLIRALRREAEAIGELRSVSIHQRFEPSDRPWLDRPEGGGLMLNTGVHGFDLLRYLTGLEPVAVRAEARRHVTQATEDQFVAIVELAEGAAETRLAVVDNARSTDSRSGRVELVGSRAQVWGDHVHRTLHRVRGRALEDLGPVPAAPTVPLALASFVDGVLAARAPEIGAADGRIAVETVAAARRSAETGRRVALQEVRVA